ncbi:Exosome complex exonuclease MTR3 [Paragonimus heterotremus]|uniref:Exosome complex exonuclease MTR3 n=1 Tax=Paragonimus heterotremus TaxID=100268 RepID=A0A8J4T5S5_9TREM|nr:Exosome complex exonuclease MTR3 [Paragonimus heterotremus]
MMQSTWMLFWGTKVRQHMRNALRKSVMRPTFALINPLVFYLNMNPSADGSAYLEYGQITMKQEGQLVPGVKFAPFVRWLHHDQKSGMEKRLSQLLLSAIESSIMLHCFPRGKYEVAAIILDIGGGAVDSSSVCDCLAAAVTCAGLALLNAGVQMYDIPVGVNVDLSAVTVNSQGRLCAAVLPKLRQFPMLFSNDTRVLDTTDLRKALDSAMDAGAKLTNTIRQCLIDHVETDVG